MDFMALVTMCPGIRRPSETPASKVAKERRLMLIPSFVASAEARETRTRYVCYVTYTDVSAAYATRRTNTGNALLRQASEETREILRNFRRKKDGKATHAALVNFECRSKTKPRQHEYMDRPSQSFAPTINSREKRNKPRTIRRRIFKDRVFDASSCRFHGIHKRRSMSGWSSRRLREHLKWPATTTARRFPLPRDDLRVTCSRQSQVAGMPGKTGGGEGR